MQFTDVEIAIKGLDEVIGKYVKFPALLVVGGHPGAGKTTFATTICVNNAKKNKKCLYLSFQEGIDKLASALGALGKEFKRLRDEGKIKFQKLPMTLDPENVVDSINEALDEIDPRIIVIDPINIPLEAAGANRRKRAVLQNFFHELPNLIDGLVILLAELPFGEVELKIGDIEFVADALIILKYRFEDSIIVRELEIRKFRGTPIKLAQFPFSITQKGIRVYPPISIKEIRRLNNVLIRTASGKLEMVYHGLKLGEVASVFYPPCCPTLQTLLLILDILKRYNMRGLLISYWLSEHELKTLLASILEHDFNLSYEKALSVVERFMPKYLEVVSINPLSMGSAELIATEIEEIESRNPDIVVYMYPEILEYTYQDRIYFRCILNKILYLKRSGKLIINLINKINEFVYNAYSSLSDVIFEVKMAEGIDKGNYICVSRSGRRLHCYQFDEIIDSNLLEKLYNSLVKGGANSESSFE